ncbi:MAG: exosortase C-terminal domain/associated protein EpsI [Pseudomonas sp.]
MKWLRWGPTMVLAIGCVLSLGLRPQLEMPLRRQLGLAVPNEIGEHTGSDHKITDGERAVSGVTDYLLRSYQNSADSAAYSIYVGYYDRQTRGRTIHSPRNCLPGGGWEALASTSAQIATAAGVVSVNRYLLQRDNERALVLYWYQGRGRVEPNEYRVKVDLLRDAALQRRSEEALVRIVVPVHQSADDAFALAANVASTVIPALYTALPE